MYVYIIYIGDSIVLSIIFFLSSKKNGNNFFSAIEKEFFLQNLYENSFIF